MTSPAKVGMSGHSPKSLIGKAEPRLKVVKKEVPALLKGTRSEPLPVLEGAPINNPEADKYQKMWSHEEYRRFSPGEKVAQLFLEKAAPNRGDTVIDFGAGTGRAAFQLAVFGGVHVTMVDFADNCLDDDIRQMLTTQAQTMRFVLADLEKNIPVSAKYGLCTDVMEHIPEDKVDIVLNNILRSANEVFFQISCIQDGCGRLIGEVLHLTVKSYEWWMEKFREHKATIHWSHNSGGEAIFYVSSWENLTSITKTGVLNTSAEVIIEHVKINAKRNLAQLRPHQTQPDTVISLLAGGPSLKDFWGDIEEKWRGGQKIVTVNGTYNECLKRGINPSAQIVTDARDHNLRFVQPVIPTCKYLLASQCHPSLFDAVPPEQIHVWHTPIGDSELTKIVEEELHARNQIWYPVPGGSTVTLRAMTLLRILGFCKMEIYGFDSCLADDGSHHAYEQKENDGKEVIISVICGGRVFRCHSWMASQAQEFLDQMRHLLLDEVEIMVHGDGLIAHILKTGAGIEQE